MGKTRPLAERFWEKVAEGPNGCWVWTAAKHDAGYGRFNIGGHRIAQAHRVAYELMVGPIPPLLVLDHLCHNRACVNPDHLDPVPLLVNSMRTEAGEINRARLTAQRFCVRGHDLNDPEVTRISPKGYRVCRQCHRDRRAEKRSLNPARPGGRKKLLTPEDVAVIDALRAIGLSWRAVADVFGHKSIWTVMSAGTRRKAYSTVEV
jgi:hypothetical protein